MLVEKAMKIKFLQGIIHTCNNALDTRKDSAQTMKEWIKGTKKYLDKRTNMFQDAKDFILIK